MRLSRTCFVASAAGALGTIAGRRYPAEAAEFSYKLAHGLPLAHPLHIRCQEAALRVKQESGGQLEILTFGNSALGTDEAMISQARIGATEFTLMACEKLMALVPTMGVTGVAFAFKSHQDVWRAMDGALGNYVNNAIVNAHVNLVTVGKAWDSGFRQVANNVRPIRTVDDLRGLKIRIPNAEVIVDTFRAAGASPTPTAGNEIYTSLQSHLVDGADVTFSATESGKYYEVVKYMSITNHLWQGQVMISNPASWQGLPKKLRDLVERSFSSGADRERADMVSLDGKAKATLENLGMVFNESDINSFRGAVRAAGLYAKWRNQFGPQAWTVLEKSVGALP